MAFDQTGTELGTEYGKYGKTTTSQERIEFQLQCIANTLLRIANTLDKIERKMK